MKEFPTVLLQCGTFVLVPILTFAAGLWLIRKTIGFERRISLILLATLIGLIFFEAVSIGMLMDPRGGFSRLSEIIETSGAVGVIVAISILVLIPLYRSIMRLFK